MKPTHTIPTGFRIPKGYRRRFILETATYKIEIVPQPPRKIRVHNWIQIDAKEPSHEDISTGLDWIAESMCIIRGECEASQ